MLRVGRIFEDVIAAIAVVDHIVAKPEVIFDHRGQRLDAVGVDLAKLFDPPEDIVELGRKFLDLLIAHRDSGELGDVPYLFVGD